MTDEQLTEQIHRVIAERRITAHGHGFGPPLVFPDTIEQVRLCLAFFRRVQRIKTPSIGCYALKHIIEREPDGNGKQYVTHGACVVAACIAGLSMRVTRVDRATIVGLSEPSIKDADGRRRTGWMCMPEIYDEQEVP
jgi:hypothetical protein